jgi:hypothetical protein
MLEAISNDPNITAVVKESKYKVGPTSRAVLFLCHRGVRFEEGRLEEC